MDVDPWGGGLVSRPADDFYLIAHDHRSGRPKVSAAVTGLGAAAAIIGELILSGHLTVRRGELRPLYTTYPPADRLLREVLAQIDLPRQEPGLTTWLRFLAGEATQDLRYRLVLGGRLTTIRTRSLVGRTHLRHLPTDPNAAAWPAIRLAGELCAAHDLTLADMVLASVVEVTGLLELVLWDKPLHSRGWLRIEQVRAELPADLAVLVAHTEAAVGDGVLTRRGV